MYLLVPQKSSTMDGDIHGSGVAKAESLHSSLHSSSDQPNNIRGGAFQQDPAGRSDSPELLMRSSFGMQSGGGSWSQTATNSNNVMHFSTSMASTNIPVVGSCPALLQTRQVPQAAGSTFKILQPEISAMRVGRNVHGLNNCEPSPQLMNGSTSYAADDQRLGPRLMTRGNSWSALDVLNTAMGSAPSPSSQCLARSFSSSPGFGEPRVAKFSSSGFNGNLYSQTQYSLPGSDGVGGIRSIMGGDNDGTKISRSFSCSRLANLAAPSNITDVRISQYDALAESKISCEIEATTMEQEARSKSAAMQYDDIKPQTRRIPGDPITSMVEAFEGATEIGGGPRHDTADEPDGSLEHSSCAEQAHGRTLQRLDCIGKRKLLQADEEEAACKDPSMANSVAPSDGRDSGSQLAAAVGPAADGDETKFAVKRRRSGVEIITKEDAKFHSVDRTLNSETSYSAGESLSSLVSMKESCTVTKLPERTSLMQQDYIHVRARRGEATDSHSIAERVRREKISERMKYLQELVPGCNKVTGKAVMLDEIINYVQSLQLQVEFLSMKLAAVNLLRLDFDVDKFLPKELLCASMAPSMSLMGPDPTAMSYGHQQQLLQQRQVNNLQSVGSSDLDQFRALASAFEASMPRTMTTAVCTPLSCLDAFADNLQQSEQSTYQVHGKESYRVSSTWDLCKAGQLAPQELHCTILFRHDMLLHGPIDTSLKCWIFQQS